MWYRLEEEGLEYYISENFTYKTNIAIFSFNKCLVKNIRNEQLCLFANSVADILLDINNHGSIIILENRFYKQQDIQRQFNYFLTLLDPNIDILAVFITKQNRYKKPNVNIMSFLHDIYTQNDKNFIKFEKEKSIAVGCNAGRFATAPFSADLEDYDRAFALNIGVCTFRTPEQFFMNCNIPRMWQWRLPHINYFLTTQKDKSEPSFSDIIKTTNKSVVFITGPLASGKTTLAYRICDYLKNKEYIHMDINKHTRGDICEALQDFNENEKKICIIVDIIYNDIYEIYKKIVKTDIIYIEIEASRDLCLFLDRMRLQVTKNNNIIAHKKEDISKWFFAEKTVSNYSIKYPLILRTRKESAYRY